MDESIINLYIFDESSRASVYGIGTYIRELSFALKNSSINVCVVHLRSDKPEKEPEATVNFRHLYIPSPVIRRNSYDLYYRNVVYLLQLYIINKNNLVFHLNFSHNGHLVDELRKAFDCRIISTIHYFNFGKKSVENEELHHSKVDHVVCLSYYMQKILCCDYNINAVKTSVIYNGLTDISDINSDIIFLRKKLNIPVNYSVILFVGRLDKSKGLKYLLQAFRIVLKSVPDCQLFITGNGAFNDFFKECDDIWMNITWTGLIEKNKLYDLYSIADIGVLPSFNEQCSYVAIEMMMHGLSMITTNAPGLSEMTEDGVSSLQVPVIENSDNMEINPELFAEKILFLLTHPKESKILGENARNRYVKHYSGDLFRNNMLDFYQSLFE